MDILLVEDSAPMRKLAATIVKRMGVEALELLQSSKVDLVRTDWSMPVMDGLDLGQDGAVVRVDVSSVMCLQSKAGPVGGYLTKVEFSSSEINR